MVRNREENMQNIETYRQKQFKKNNRGKTIKTSRSQEKFEKNDQKQTEKMTKIDRKREKIEKIEQKKRFY